MRNSYLLLFFFFFSYPANSALADDYKQANSLRVKETNLIFPKIQRELYQKKFSKLSNKQQWRIKIHGLRNTPLHPDIWAVRIIDRTDNRKLVPIRPFFLRASERKDFRIEEIKLRFAFDDVQLFKMQTAPHIHEPMFEIGFAGKFEKGLKGERSKIDRGYMLRFTASPHYQSGIWYRSHTKRLILAHPKTPQLEPGKEYEVRISFAPNKVSVFVNDEAYCELTGDKLNEGLISLITGWHPIALRELEVRGTVEKKGSPLKIVQSGLLNRG